MIDPNRPPPKLIKLPKRPGKRPYAIEVSGARIRIYCTVEELQGLADALNDELDSLVQS